MEESKNVTIIIDLSKKFKNLKGEEIGKVSMGRTLAQYFVDISTSDSRKLFEISVKLLDDKPIEISEDDYNRICYIIDQSTMSNIMQVRLLEALGKALRIE